MMRLKRQGLRSHLWPIALVAVLASNGEQGHADNHETTAIAHVDVTLTPDLGGLQSISYGWRFDPNFSADMLESFDENGDARLDAAELREASEAVYDTIKDYRYFLLLSREGKPIAVKPPARMAATYQASQLSVAFKATPAEPVPLTGRIEIGVFDPTFSIDFGATSTIKIDGLPPRCSSALMHPDFDDVVDANPQALNDDPAEDPDGARTIALFAQRLVVTCKPK